MLWFPPRRRTLCTAVLLAPAWLPLTVGLFSGCASVDVVRHSLTLASPAAVARAAGRNAASPAAEAAAAGNFDSAADTEPVFDELPPVPRVATSQPAPGLITAPRPFRWNDVGRSTGGRPFQMVSAGSEGYRTLVVGSVGGDDPVAVALVEQLARHLHDNLPILGGYEASVIRTLNPDGAANRNHMNQKNVYVNSAFPQARAAAGKPKSDVAEVAFLLQQLQTRQPQRVIHIRTIRGERGVIASNSAASTAAREVAEWLNLQQLELSTKSAAGSLERFLAEQGNSQVITLGIPSTDRAEEVWQRYGDALLNLLLGDDLATRDIARRALEQSSADRRSREPASP